MREDEDEFAKGLDRWAATRESGEGLGYETNSSGGLMGAR
jgi:hypothetical protein